MLSYVELREHFYSTCYSDVKSREAKNLLCKLEEFINPNDIKHYYPKNLFKGDKSLEVYLIFEKYILIGRVLEENKIELKTLRLRELINIKAECENDSDGCNKLTLTFFNNEAIIFDSEEDTNNSWKYKFKDHIKMLTNYLLNTID